MAKNLQDPAAFLPQRRPSKNTDCPWTASFYSRSDGKGSMYNLREQGSSTGQLILSTKGLGFFRGADHSKYLCASPGDLLYYEPGAFQEYGDLLNNRWEYHWVHFTPKPQWKNWLNFPLPCDIPGLHRAAFKSEKQLATASALFREIQRHLRYGGPWRMERALNLVESILLLAWEENQTFAHEVSDERIKIALDTIASDPFQNFSVGALANKAGLSPSRFAHLFKRETGLSVVQSIIQSKLNEARNLLASSSKSIAEIADILGFSSAEYLCLLFKRHFGAPPSKFRRSLRK